MQRAWPIKGQGLVIAGGFGASHYRSSVADARAGAGCDNTPLHFQRCTTMDKDSSDTPGPGDPGTPESPPGSAPRERPTPEGDGLDPTRYGDWEKNGRCVDF
jgi:hypothetical protein